MNSEQIQKARRRFLGSRLWQYTEGMPDEMAINIQVVAVGGGLNMTLGELRALKADLERNDTAELLNTLDPDTLDAIADELGEFHHSARADSLRAIARKQRAAIKKARGD